MFRSVAAVLLATSLLAPPSAAQHAGHQGHPPTGSAVPRDASPARPYAGLQDRRVKALSEAQQADLRAGRGMALALAAELNGYPGPMHVLEHAGAVGLTVGQRAATEALRARMAAEARAIGARIVALEEELDALFGGGDADPGRLAALTAALGALNGRLREAHLAMRATLDHGQREAYSRLRGYTAAR